MREGFHTAFAEALKGDFSAVSPWLQGPDGELRFSVYRNTVAKGLTDALAAQFPTVAKAAGEAWMREAGLRFARRHPPAEASLLAYGQAFPSWLETYPGADDAPWLIDLARLDEGWRRSFFASDMAPLPADAVTRLEPSDFAGVGVELHPACVFLDFADGAGSLWLALQDDDSPSELEMSGDPEAIVFLRPDLAVTPARLSPGAAAFLDACARRRPLAEAAEAALAREPGIDLTGVFSQLISGGAFARLVTILFRDFP